MLWTAENPFAAFSQNNRMTDSKSVFFFKEFYLSFYRKQQYQMVTAGVTSYSRTSSKDRPYYKD